MKRRQFLIGGVSLAALAAMPARAEIKPLKVGLIVPMTGPFASVGRQVQAGVNAWLALHGDVVEGRKIEIVLRDDGAVADQTRRIAQELIVNEGVEVLTGFGLTPLALSVAPVISRAKVPAIIMAAGTATITEASPYFTRTSCTAPQTAWPTGKWAAQNKIKRIVTLVSDYGPGVDAETWFTKSFVEGGGEVVESVRVPLQNPDFAPFLQRVLDGKPDALFVFLPSGAGGLFMKQYADRNLAGAGIRLIGTGDLTDDDLLPAMGSAALGTVTAHFYSAAHESAANKAYVAEVGKSATGMRPNFMSVGGYDGIALIAAALKETGGVSTGPELIAAMKGQSWESPRGPVSIDAETRDIIQNVYMREVREVDGGLWNVEFDTFEAVKDPAKAKL